MSFYRIAELLVEMEPAYHTGPLSEPYRVEASGPADILIDTSPQTIQARLPGMSPEYGEYLVTGEQFYLGLVRYDGILLHASCVVTEGKAYLFSGDCGAGKSTHTSLWLRLLGEKAYILNDDKPAIRLLDGEVQVFGTPWSGKNGINRNEKVPLGGICFLSQSEENRIAPIAPLEAVPLLLEQTTRRLDAASMGQLLTTLDRVLSQCSVYRLNCNMELSAAQLSYQTMTGRTVE